MASTYTPIATTTASGSSGTITFSGISGSYTDLILIYAAKDGNSSTEGNANIQFNSDTGSNYSYTNLYGNGSSAGSSRASSTTLIPAYTAGGTASNFGARFAPLKLNKVIPEIAVVLCHKPEVISNVPAPLRSSPPSARIVLYFEVFA